MPNKYTWSDLGQNEQNIAGSRLAGEILARIGAHALSLPAARDAVLAELLAETTAGPVEFDAGTVGAPAIYLNADTDTGIYWIGANNLGIAAAGAKVLDIGTAGLGVTGTLTVSGATTLNSTVSITGLTVISDQLQVSGTAILNDIFRNTSDGSDNSKVRICGGGAISNTRGARVEVHGNEDASPGALVLAAGNVAGSSITFEENGATPGTVNDAGVFAWSDDMTVGGTFAVTGDTTLTGQLVVTTIRRNTADGADTSLLQLLGGGGAGDTRGAFLHLYGNEHATQAGDVILTAGNVSGGTIVFQTGGANRGTITDAGVLSWTGALTAASLNLGGATLLDILSATLVHDFGSIAALSRATTTVTVTGAAVGDAVFIAANGIGAATPTAMIFYGYVSATDTVTIIAYNTHASEAEDPSSQTLRVVVTKF